MSFIQVGICDHSVSVKQQPGLSCSDRVSHGSETHRTGRLAVRESSRSPVTASAPSVPRMRLPLSLCTRTHRPRRPGPCPAAARTAGAGARGNAAF